MCPHKWCINDFDTKLLKVLKLFRIVTFLFYDNIKINVKKLMIISVSREIRIVGQT